MYNYIDILILIVDISSALMFTENVLLILNPIQPKMDNLTPIQLSEKQVSLPALCNFCEQFVGSDLHMHFANALGETKYEVTKSDSTPTRHLTVVLLRLDCRADITLRSRFA